MTLTSQQVSSAIEAAAALGLAIKTLGSVPSGHLYARVMTHVSVENYNTIVQLLKDQRLVSERAHVLTWIGNE